MFALAPLEKKTLRPILNLNTAAFQGERTWLKLFNATTFAKERNSIKNLFLQINSNDTKAYR